MEGEKNNHFLTYVQRIHRHSLRHLKLWFVPHSENEHQPHALRPNALKTYAIILIGVKIVASAVLFVAYPNPAQFAALTTKNMVNLTNQSRKASGLKPLAIDTKLQKAAEAKARDMVAKGYFAHTSPSGVRFFTWIQKTGYNYTIAGENLAMDFTSAEGTHEALMNSPSHRENILNTKYTQVGMAVMSGKIDGSDTVVLVEMFGAPYVAKTKVAEKPKTTTKPTTAKPVATPTTPPKSTVKSDVDVPASTYIASVDSQNVNTVESVAGNAFSFSVTIKNAGTATWSKNAVLVPNEATNTLLQDAGTQTYPPVDKSIPPNESGVFTASVQLPKNSGEYELHFSLVDGENPISSSDISIAAMLTEPLPVQISQNTAIEQTVATQEELTLAKNETLSVIRPIEQKNEGFIPTFLNITQRFLFGFLAFLIITLLMNVFINIKVQHGHVIVQSCIVIILASLTLLAKTSFLEHIGTNLRIL